MSCDIFTGMGLGLEGNCPFEAICNKRTVEKCRTGQIIRGLELLGKLEFETDDDLRQQEILEQLEAKAKSNTT